jgi:hypothetical protein
MWGLPRQNRAMPAPRTSNTLKLIRGTAKPSRTRAELPARGDPEWPTHIEPPSPDEAAAFAWLVGALPDAMANSDAMILVLAARTMVQLEVAEGHVRTADGKHLVRGSEGGVARGAHSRVVCALRAEVAAYLSQLGLTPQGRLKLATNDGGASRIPLGQPSSWSELD